MSNTAIKVEEISKLYRLGQISTGTISHDLNRWWHRARGKEDPYTKIGEANDRTTKSKSDYVWSLKDINFEIKKGEAVGIIGRNGAGKSTLLKLMSKVTAPTTGKIKVNGRIASLLEVGTGFHPELTGRENIFLNGAILGMSKVEIRRKFDEIVDFSGVERYIDTPVKRYSSGMYVRLAFAVAAHLESEILIVDEVLAVGDAEFQKKCLSKMNDVSKGEGRTVLFVSHNMAAVRTLTDKSVYLKNGAIRFLDDTEKTVNLYFEDNREHEIDINYYENQQVDEEKPIELLKAEVKNEDDHLGINIEYIVRKNVGSVVSIRINNSKEVPIITLRDTDLDSELFAKKPGVYKIKFRVPLHFLSPDVFKVTFSFSDMKSERFDYHPDLLTFRINEAINNFDLSTPREGIILPYKSYIEKTMTLK